MEDSKKKFKTTKQKEKQHKTGSSQVGQQSRKIRAEVWPSDPQQHAHTRAALSSKEHDLA